MPTIDIALAVERILPAAEYYGSTTANTPESWAAVDWRDTRRAKPTWEEVEAAAGPTLDEARTAKIAEINTGYASVLGYIRAGYPPDEVQTWTMQAEQARELAENPEAQALFVRYLAAVKGVEADEMARRILVNAQNWEPVAGMLTAQRQLMEEAAEKAQTMAEVEAIKVGYSV